MIVVRALFLAMGLACLVPALAVFRLAVRDWSKLRTLPPFVRLLGLGLLGGIWLITAGLLIAAAAVPHDAEPLLLTVGGVWAAREIAMRFTAQRVTDALPPHDG
ncbi:MAG: hypothetical protein QOG85_671 [Gaiellaceae bacterium]|jgi:hypothetical protein|nr:hypothetical protein [Gaiellaceae bacterium]